MDAMYVTGRSVMTQTDGSRRASCAYFPEDVGDRGPHLFYSYQDGGVMPEAGGLPVGVILGTALERLPDEVTIPDGTPEGPCYFSGGGASLEVILLTDPDRAAQASVKPADITHADLGDGGKVDLTDAESLSARVNLGERVVVITATYDAISEGN